MWEQREWRKSVFLESEELQEMRRLVSLPEHTGGSTGSSGDIKGDSDSNGPDRGFIVRFRHFRAGAGLNST